MAGNCEFALKDPFRLWNGAEEQQLREGWENHTALPDVVTGLRSSEPTIAHHLINLGLARDAGEVVDRLGATAGGSVEARARLLRAELEEAIYVLVVDRPRRPVVSLHHGPEEAEKALREFVGDPPPPKHDGGSAGAPSTVVTPARAGRFRLTVRSSRTPGILRLGMPGKVIRGAHAEV